jgi:hypoxanthine-guanine phosphoribosyltransferase
MGAGIVITQSETAMETQRYVKQTWLNLISALLGSIFGLMRTFAGSMSFCEILVDRYQRKETTKRNARKLKDLTHVFDKRRGKSGKAVKNLKVLPVYTNPE